MNKNKISRLDTPFVLMTFCVFAMSVFLVLILSGSAYRNMVDLSSYGQNERIALSYIRTKIRQADMAGAVGLGDFGGVPALNLFEDIVGREFVTRIYFYNGWIYELFHETALEMRPSDGIPIIQVGQLEFFERENGLIEIATGHGSVQLFPRSGLGVAR